MKRLIAATAALALLAPIAAQAKDDHGKNNNGKRHDAPVVVYREGPPGLAKKPYGLPPGQAKKMWARGQRLPTTYINQTYYVVEPVRYHLAPAPYGYRWVHVGDQYYLAQTQTGLITQVVSALLR